MASILRSRKNELTDAQIASVQLSNRQVHGEYVTYTALSSNGVDTYTVTLNAAGKAVGCQCPSTVPCKHRAAAEFEEEWTSNERREEELAGASVIAASVMGDDMSAHIDDSMGEMEAIAAEIIADELVQREMASLPDIDSGFFDDIWAMQAAKAKKPVSMVERKRERYGDDTKPFSLLKPA